MMLNKATAAHKLLTLLSCNSAFNNENPVQLLHGVFVWPNIFGVVGEHGIQAKRQGEQMRIRQIGHSPVLTVPSNFNLPNGRE